MGRVHKIYHEEYEEEEVEIRGRSTCVTMPGYRVDGPLVEPMEIEDFTFVYGPGTGTRQVVARAQARQCRAELDALYEAGERLAADYYGHVEFDYGAHWSGIPDGFSS